MTQLERTECLMFVDEVFVGEVVVDRDVLRRRDVALEAAAAPEAELAQARRHFLAVAEVDVGSEGLVVVVGLAASPPSARLYSW